MPKVIKKQAWEITFREEVSNLCKGWNVKERRGKVFLRVRTDGKEISLYLPFEWQKDQKTKALNRIQNIYYQVKENGRSISDAAKVCAGEAPKLVIEHDWQGALERFEIQKKQHGNSIKEVTWKTKYLPVITKAVELLTTDNAPANPEDLIDKCISQWQSASRAREIGARNLVQFLKYCVLREKFPVVWMPTTEPRDHIGQKPTNAESNKGDPITDIQIINLISNLPSDSPGLMWADAIRLMSELGLRPIELNYLSVKTDKTTGRLFWWCSYRKRGGGGTTQPRELHPLPLVNSDGELEKWNLMERWQAKLLHLPNLEDPNALKTYLYRQVAWNSLKEELKNNDEKLVPYSFRHSYSVRGHQRGIDGGSMAEGMGHSFETHCRSYPYATKSGTANAFVKANNLIISK